MADAELLLRGAVIGAALHLALLFVRSRPPAPVGAAGILLLAGTAAYTLWGLPASPGWPLPARLILVALAAPAPFFLWLLVRLIFEDGVRVRVLHLLWLVPMEIFGIAAMATRGIVEPQTTHLLTLGFRLPSLLLIGHALWRLWRERAGDLVERRRMLRLGVLGAAAVLAVLVIAAALLTRPAPDRGPVLRLVEAGVLLALLLGAGTAFAGIDRALLPAQPAAPPVPPPPGAIPAEDAAALARLDSLMREGTVWRDAGLTVGGLAAQVGVPEYRLRRLINGRLGHRNFSAFLNEHRLAAAVRFLADPAMMRTPVLTIALDLGYGSIGPFNRAFRARYGVTPTEYRRTALAPDAAETLAEI